MKLSEKQSAPDQQSLIINRVGEARGNVPLPDSQEFQKNKKIVFHEFIEDKEYSVTDLDLGYLPFGKDDAEKINRWLKIVYKLDISQAADMKNLVDNVDKAFTIAKKYNFVITDSLSDLAKDIVNSKSINDVLTLFFRSGIGSEKFGYAHKETPIYCEFLKLLRATKHFYDHSDKVDYKETVKTSVKEFADILSNEFYAELKVKLTSLNKKGNRELKSFDNLSDKELKKTDRIYWRVKTEEAFILKLLRNPKADFEKIVRDQGALTVIKAANFFNKNKEDLKVEMEKLKVKLIESNKNLEITIKIIDEIGHPMKGKPFLKLFDTKLKIGYEIQFLDPKTLINSKKSIEATVIYNHYKYVIEQFSRSGYISEDIFDRAVKAAVISARAKKLPYGFEEIKNHWLGRGSFIKDEKYGYMSPAQVQRLYIEQRLSGGLATLSVDFFKHFIDKYLSKNSVSYKDKILEVFETKGLSSLKKNVLRAISSCISSGVFSDESFSQIVEGNSRRSFS